MEDSFKSVFLHKDRRWSSQLVSCINTSTVNEGQDKKAVNNKKKNKNQGLCQTGQYNRKASK